MFLIQTRRQNNARGIMNSHGDAKDWVNYQHQFTEIEKAKRECELIISAGQCKSENIRIVEVVCTFESEIIVKAKGHKN